MANPLAAMSTLYPGRHDLLLGRGGETNNHSGNIKFRRLIEEYKPIYQSAPKGRKPEIAQMLVDQWRALDPPGRFLAKSPHNDELWVDIGDVAARRRASKSLGERSKRSIVADPAPPLPTLASAPTLKRKRQTHATSTNPCQSPTKMTPKGLGSGTASVKPPPNTSVPLEPPFLPTFPNDQSLAVRSLPTHPPTSTSTSLPTIYTDSNKVQIDFSTMVSERLFGAMSKRPASIKSKNSPDDASKKKSSVLGSFSQLFKNSAATAAATSLSEQQPILPPTKATSRAQSPANSSTSSSAIQQGLLKEGAGAGGGILNDHDTHGLVMVVDQIPTAAELTGAFRSDCSSTDSDPSVT